MTWARVSLELHANAVVPLLTLDKAIGGADGAAGKEQLVNFKIWSTHAPEHESHHKKVVLSNNNEKELTFTLATDMPFAVTRTHCLAPKHPLALGASSKASVFCGAVNPLLLLSGSPSRPLVDMNSASRLVCVFSSDAAATDPAVARPHSLLTLGAPAVVCELSSLSSAERTLLSG